MVTQGVLALISMVWLGFGITLTATPSWCRNWIGHSVHDPAHRFLISQGAILLGLFLLLGTPTYRGFWLWATMGTMGILKGLFLLGSSDLHRKRVVEWLMRIPSWALRVGGTVSVLLAAILAVEIVRGLP